MHAHPLVQTRKAFITSLSLLSFLPAVNPKPAYASYAMYAARQKEWNERTDNGSKPLTNDTGLVKDAQERYYDQSKAAYERDKKYYEKNRPRKCMGLTSAVTPLLENACVEIQEPVVSSR